MEFIFEDVRAKTIEGFDKYFITERGELYRKRQTGGSRRLIGSLAGGHTYREGRKVVSPESVKYVQYMYSQDGNKGRSQAHRLVAEAWLPNPHNLEMVDHIDENKLNNHVDNLRWVSAQDNQKHYHDMHGRRSYVKRIEAKEKKVRDSFRNYEAEVAKLDVHEKDAMKRIDELVLEGDRLEVMIKEKKQRLKNETERLTSQREGTVYGSVDEMIAATGVKCMVNGVVYPSAGSAAQFIVDNYPNASLKSTISKAIRRMLQGNREPWCMYERFNIDRVA